ncbi:MAG: hypothetical protein WC758_08290 [Candidatus Woesearchaeota archaeon]
MQFQIKNITSILCVLILCSIIVSSDEFTNSYIVTISETKGQIKVENIEKAPAFISGRTYNPGDYIVGLYFTGQELYSTSASLTHEKFNARKEECLKINLETGNSYYDTICDPIPSYEYIETAITTIVIPYIPIGDEIRIYDSKDNLVFVKSVSDSTNYCGDGKCVEDEIFLTCPLDCKDAGNNFKTLNLGDTTLNTENKFTIFFKENACLDETTPLTKCCIEFTKGDVSIITEDDKIWMKSKDYESYIDKECRLVTKNKWPKIPYFKMYENKECKYIFNANQNPPIKYDCVN